MPRSTNEIANELLADMARLTNAAKPIGAKWMAREAELKQVHEGASHEMRDKLTAAAKELDKAMGRFA